MRLSSDKATLLLFVGLGFASVLHFAQGKTTIIIRNRKGAGHDAHDVRVRGYSYGEPISGRRTLQRAGTNVQETLKLRRRRENQTKNYAKRYKTWTQIRKSPFKAKPTAYSGWRANSPHSIKYSENDVPLRYRRKESQKLKIKNLRRPTPPSEDFDADDYFPEETQGTAAHYIHVRRPIKKRRIPIERKKKKKKRKKPVTHTKSTFEDEDGKGDFDDERNNEELMPFRKRKRQPSVSYSTFIQHSADEGGDSDYYHDYSSPEDTGRKHRKKKKGRIKKTAYKHRSEEDTDNYSSDSPREYEVEPGGRTAAKKHKQDTLYGSGHISLSELPLPSYASSKLLNKPVAIDHPLQQQSSQSYHHAPPSVLASSQGLANTRSAPVYSQPGLHYGGSSQPNPEYPQQNSNTFSLTGSHSYSYDVPRQSAPASAVQYPGLAAAAAASPYHNEGNPSYPVNSVHSSSIPVSSHSDFSSNRYSSYSPRYSDRGGSTLHGIRGGDEDSDFLQKHQNLYNNGITGVPVQGNGYVNRDSKNDFDIGYGEFQFDENPA